MLGCILDRLGPHLADVVDDFYAGLGLRPEFAEVVGRLTPEEFAHLRRRQVEHLRFMLSEAGGPERLAARSREVGRVHAMVGVEMDWYVDAMTEHRDGLLRALARYAGDLDLVAANVALSERMMKDLHGALLGFRDLDAVQNEVMLRCSRLPRRPARSPTWRAPSWRPCRAWTACGSASSCAPTPRGTW